MLRKSMSVSTEKKELAYIAELLSRNNCWEGKQQIQKVPVGQVTERLDNRAV